MSVEKKVSEVVRCSICGNIIKGEMIDVELLHAICKKGKNTRYLVKYGNEYSTIKIPTKTSVKKADFDKGKNGEEKKDKNEGYLLNYRMSLIKPHMEEYKENRLKINENGEYRGKKYPHILPDDQEKSNLIQKNSDSYKNALEEVYNQLLEEPKQIHQGFSHLNSSQAFALNFFVPIIKENKLDEFLKTEHPLENTDNARFCGVISPCPSRLDPKETDFEKVLKIPFGKKEGTNFDVCFKTNQNTYITFEVKYSEENFGKAEDDENHNKKYNDIYKSALETLIGKEPDDNFKEKFFKQYQLWRNLIYTTKDCDVCFIFPKFRTDLTAEVEAARALCNEEYQTKIHIFYVDDFVNKMINGNDDKLKNYYEEFKIKYLDLENEVQEIKK